MANIYKGGVGLVDGRRTEGGDSDDEQTKLWRVMVLSIDRAKDRKGTKEEKMWVDWWE